MLVCNYLSEEMLISLCIPLFLGMLPLLGSSTSDSEESVMESFTFYSEESVVKSFTFDSEEEPEEMCMKLQIMKGE